MLPPDSRTVLTDALKPPPGWVFDRAIALTFTVDLTSALVVPLAFAANGIRETADPLHVMEVVRSCADRVDIFCQAGQVSVPKQGSDLLAFLEPMIHPVRQPRPGFLFHPKLWAVRYRDPESGARALRVLILSRNLTSDRSWDVCLRLDGMPGSRRPANKPLRELVRASVDLVVESLSPERVSAISELAEELYRAEWELPEGVKDVSFYALGIRGAQKPTFRGTRAVAISPFVNEQGVALTLDAREKTLIGRQEELDRLPQSVLDGVTTYVIDEFAELANEDDGESALGALSGLHAKLYVVEYGHQARVLLGSANSTSAAFGGNVELLAELHGSSHSLGVAKTLSADDGIAAILAPYERREAEDEDEQQWQLEELLRAIAVVPLTATVGTVDEQFRLRLTSDKIMPDLGDARVIVELLTRRGEKRDVHGAHTVDVTFAGLDVTDITPFIVVTADAGSSHRASTVIRAQLVNDPEDRLDRVLARQIDTPEKFLQFLALLLGLGGDGSSLAALATPGAGGSWIAPNGHGILELLLTALADKPHQLDDLARIVERLSNTDQGRNVLPPGFAELWKIVDEARSLLTAGGAK